MKKNIEITISPDILQARLVKVLAKGGEPHSELVAKQIIDHLELTEMGLSQLISAFMGMEDQINWIVGDECMISTEKLSSWEYDKDLSDAAGLIYKDHFKGVISNIDIRKKKSVEFEFTAVYHNTAPEPRKIKIWIKAEDLKREVDMLLVRPTVADMV